MPADRRETIAEFKRFANMTPKALSKWLEGHESRSVGMTHSGEKVTDDGGEESVGHEMGRRIIDLKATKQANLTEDDIAAMRKVVGYVHRHGKQRPQGDVTGARWRHSLMNWGHDPLKG